MNSSSSRSSNEDARGRDARAPSLRRSLLFAACIALSASLAVAVTALKPNGLKSDSFAESTGPARVATAAEQRAILIAVVEHRQPEWFPRSDARGAPLHFSLEDVTVAVCANPRRSQKRCREVPPQSAETLRGVGSLSNVLVDALPRFNAGQQPLDNQNVPGILPIDHRRVAAISGIDFWPEFHKTFPQSAGILRISRAVVSSRGDHALMYVARSYGNLGGEGGLELLELRQGRWRVIGHVGLWMS
ncbi:hypothetical protein [Pseudomonas sp. CGJS7]|uniref:hypothetical protein n=1 Tax=Pseudomonas sp. CGJS7 TaxID=3109348 RepID=UPI003009765E